jgi:flagellar protein FliO/FliZ
MGSLIWFIAIVAMIPVALWLLKRTPMGGGGAGQGVLRSVAALPLSTNQRIVTVEVGQGDARRWLVLGVTAQSITTLHTMEPQEEPISVRAAGFDTSARTGSAGTAFAQLLGKLRQDRGNDGR